MLNHPGFLKETITTLWTLKTIRFTKEWELEKETKVNTEFLLKKKFRNHLCLFICILPDYMANDSSKKLFKNIHFENTRAGFLLRCQTHFDKKYA